VGGLSKCPDFCHYQVSFFVIFCVLVMHTGLTTGLILTICVSYDVPVVGLDMYAILIVGLFFFGLY